VVLVAGVNQVVMDLVRPLTVAQMVVLDWPVGTVLRPIPVVGVAAVGLARVTSVALGAVRVVQAWS
jgi:hypothetical protein